MTDEKSLEMQKVARNLNPSDPKKTPSEIPWNSMSRNAFTLNMLPNLEQLAKVHYDNVVKTKYFFFGSQNGWCCLLYSLRKSFEKNV